MCGSKKIQNGKKKTYSTNGAGITGYQHVEEWKQIRIYRHAQNSSPNGWKASIITLNLTEEKVGSTLECIGKGNNFINKTPVAETLRATISKWDLLKLRIFCKAKGHGQQDKTAAYRMGKDFHQPHIRQIYFLIFEISYQVWKLASPVDNNF